MEYFLRRASIGPQVVIGIEKDRYDLLANARRTLIDAGTFEQHYELLLGNFKAYEMYCAKVSLEASVEFSFRYETWASILSEANRHAINFLATSKLYADQVVRDFKHLTLDEPFSDTAKRFLSEAYDTTLAYRFVCELRNHVLHRAYAVHSSRSSGKDASWFENTALYCQKSRILEDRGKFKQHVLDELEENIDVLEMFRNHMVATSQAHNKLRKIIAPACEKARSDIKKAMGEFTEAQLDGPTEGNLAVGLTACIKEDGKWTRPVSLLLDWDDARVALAQKNGHRISLPKKKPPSALGG